MLRYMLHVTCYLVFQGMEEILDCFLTDENVDMKRQIQFILRQLNLGILQFS